MGTLQVVVLLAFLQSSLGAHPKHCTGSCRHGDSNALMPFVMRLKEEHSKRCKIDNNCGHPIPSISHTPCVNGTAGPYDCNNVDLLSLVNFTELGSAGKGNDIWGWTDQKTKREYAIVGCTDGTSFVDVTNPTAPQVLGFLETEGEASTWRDMKVYKNHAFIVSEAPNHGIQVFNLTRLRGMTSYSGRFRQDAHYSELMSSHNIVGNEETGYMYVVGTNTCNGGLHIINVQDPLNPIFEGCYGDDGYVHDAQCVIYRGPDTRFKGREVCFCYNEDTLTIVDVEDKNNITMLSRTGYVKSSYTHQGWLNENQTHLMMNDELDEIFTDVSNTRSIVWNVENLKKPFLSGFFYSTENAIDHNLYIKGNIAYQSNYCAGLRIIDVQHMQENPPKLEELGFFDVAPYCNRVIFSGSWSSYPFFDSGTIIVQSIEHGLFILKYTGRDPSPV